MKAIVWNSYMDLHRPVKANGSVRKQVMAGMMKGKTVSQKKRIKQEIEDRKFFAILWIRGQQIVGTIVALYFLLLILLPDGAYEKWNAHLVDRVNHIGKPYGYTYIKKDIPTPLLSAVGKPKTAEAKVVVVTPAPTPEPEVTGVLELPDFNDERVAYIKQKKRADLIFIVWRRESTWGKNNQVGSLQHICESKGQVNEIGWGGMALKLCFTDYKAQFDRLDRWFAERSHMTDAQALCSYNLGPNHQLSKGGTCEYAKALR